MNICITNQFAAGKLDLKLKKPCVYIILNVFFLCRKWPLKGERTKKGLNRKEQNTKGERAAISFAKLKLITRLDQYGAFHAD